MDSKAVVAKRQAMRGKRIFVDASCQMGYVDDSNGNGFVGAGS
jgi:hypothetical protein